MEAQSLSVKRAQVEFHNFASLGQPERVLAAYAEENRRRQALLSSRLDYLGALSPFLEIGANAGHTSYLLANHFGADGFALDISADALRHGVALMDHWKIDRAPVRIAGDALHLPFRDDSLRFVATFQTLSQFLDLDTVFREVRRVLQPGGVFCFGEEPIRRMLTLRLFRCPYYDSMKPWERRLYDWGLLGFLVKDVIGAGQEESFGIRQNHSMTLHDWRDLMLRHFVDPQWEIIVPQRGWAERTVRSLGRRIDRCGSDWVPARLLGGTIAGFCRKPGNQPPSAPAAAFESLLRCPDCGGSFALNSDQSLRCAACGYLAPNLDGVYNLLPSRDRTELYPGDRPDILDFSRPNHEHALGEGWYELEGVFGNRYRWIGARAVARLARVNPRPQKLRLRGFAPPELFSFGQPVRVALRVNGQDLRSWTLDRSGLFVLEAPVPDDAAYAVEISASPVWVPDHDERPLSVNISALRLVDRD